MKLFVVSATIVNYGFNERLYDVKSGATNKTDR